MNAYEQLIKFLRPNENVEAIVFGPWGWGCDEIDELVDGPIPSDKQGLVMSLKSARPLMQSWKFNIGSFDAPTYYAVYIWTNERVIWAIRTDGFTRLSSVPRNPIQCTPEVGW